MTEDLKQGFFEGTNLLVLYILCALHFPSMSLTDEAALTAFLLPIAFRFLYRVLKRAAYVGLLILLYILGVVTVIVMKAHNRAPSFIKRSPIAKKIVMKADKFGDFLEDELSKLVEKE